jgi:hypothetical protein
LYGDILDAQKKTAGDFLPFFLFFVKNTLDSHPKVRCMIEIETRERSEKDANR